MDREDTDASIEDLDLSMTQQPQIFFIPYGLAVTLTVGMFVIGTKFHTWKIALVLPVLWTLAAVWVKRDHNALRVLHTKLRFTRVWVTAHRWGGWSAAMPAPLRGRARNAS
jgi:type IV secretory pathway VirB3-like protein